MKYVTELMDKVFSDSTPDEFKNAVSEKIEEARQNGSAELKDADNHLSFAESNGEVVIEDKKNDNEITKAATNADGDTELSAVTKAESATQPDVVVPRQKGEDGKGVAPENATHKDLDVTVKETEGIVDGDKAGLGKNFSVVVSGFDSIEAANMFYSELVDGTARVELTEDCLTFSDEELENIAFSATEANELYERMLGTQDLTQAFSLVELTEDLKAYSVLAESFGHDLSDVYEAAKFYSEEAMEMINDTFSEMDVNEFFSELSEDEINDYFSDLNEVEANVLFSALEDENNTYTFSELDEIINQCYSEMELEAAVNDTFSDATEDEINTFFSALSPSEMNVVMDCLDENPNASFSDLNEALEYINQPVDVMFSEMSDNDLEEVCSSFSDSEIQVLQSMVESEDNFIFSDFLDYVIENREFSDEDAKTVCENCNNLEKADKELKESKDPELAKKVKVLADQTLEDAEKGEQAGHDMEDVKKMCAQYSENAAKVLDEAGVDPNDSSKKDEPKDEPGKSDKPKDEPGKSDEPKDDPTKAETKKAETQVKSFSESYLGLKEQKVFGKIDTKVSGSNPCLFSKIN